MSSNGLSLDVLRSVTVMVAINWWLVGEEVGLLHSTKSFFYKKCSRNVFYFHLFCDSAMRETNLIHLDKDWYLSQWVAKPINNCIWKLVFCNSSIKLTLRKNRKILPFLKISGHYLTRINRQTHL